MTPAEGGTLQALRRLVWLLVLPVLVLLAVLTLLQYQQRMQNAERDLQHRASERAQELEALAQPAVHQVHDLVRLLQLQWDQPPDAATELAQALQPAFVAQATDGWSLDQAPAATRKKLGQVWWAPPDRRPPEALWLRRAQAFNELARIAQERSPALDATWFVAGALNLSFGYPWVSTAEMLQAMGLPTLRAMEGPRVSAMESSIRNRQAGGVTEGYWSDPYVGQLNGELVQSHATQVWLRGSYLGEVSVDLSLTALQRLAQRWRSNGSQLWVASDAGLVLADAQLPLAAPAAPRLVNTRVSVQLASRLPSGVAAADLAQLMARASVDGSAGVLEAADWALVVARRAKSPWTYVEAVPLQQLRLAVLPTLLPNALLGLALLLVFVLGHWLINHWFVSPALEVLSYMRQLSLDASVPAPALGPRWQGWVRAITDTFAKQRTLQQRERAHEAFRSAMVDNAPMAIVTQDNSGRVVDFNPAAERLLGLPRAAAVGQRLPAQLLPGALAAAPAVATGVAPSPALSDEVFDITGQRSDGTPFPAQVQHFELPLETGTYQIAFITDLTARHAALRQIENQREALRQSEKLSAMGSLLAGVAHELNNPLSVVMGRASLLEEKLESGAVLDDVHRIRLAAERCGRIVRTFLNMARQRPAQRRAVQLGDVVQAAADMLGYTLRSHGIVLELQLHPASALPLPEVQADPDQLGQVVLNLIVNAQQALLSDLSGNSLRGVPSTGRPQPRRITITSGQEEPRPGRHAWVWLRVADNGPGVPAALRSHIFEPFYTTKDEGLGTGLGLSVSRALVREHGGSLVLENSAEGACFRLSLPISGREEAGPPAPTTAPPLDAGGTTSPRVLVVDDEPELAELMRAMLEGAGLEVATAESGAVALELLREARFDAVVSDVRMPDMDGPTLWRAVQAVDATLARRTLFVSGDTLASPAAQWVAQQGLQGLDKPFTADELLAAVQRALAAPAGLPLSLPPQP